MRATVIVGGIVAVTAALLIGMSRRGRRRIDDTMSRHWIVQHRGGTTDAPPD